MGRIVTKVKVSSYADPNNVISFNALVDTGAAHLSLPSAWRDQFGDLEVLAEIDVKLADQSDRKGEICGPVKIRIGGFRPIMGEVLFLDMQEDEDGEYEPLVGYIPLEAVNAGVDMMGHRLIHMKRYDMK